MTAREQREVLTRMVEADAFDADDFHRRWATFAPGNCGAAPTPTAEHFTFADEVVAKFEAVLGEPAWDGLRAFTLVGWGFEVTNSQIDSMAFWQQFEEFFRSRQP